MNATSVDIAEMLEAQSSLGLTLGSNLFVGKEPTKPDNTVTIFDTYGMPPQLALTSQGLENPTIQIRVRNTSYTNGWAIIHSIEQALHGRGQEVWNETLYSVIYCASGPVNLDWDDNSRARFICNFNVQRREND